MNKAVFYDRDGIILQMVYDLEHGTIETVRTTEQISFIPDIIILLKHTTALGYLNIIVSNQPGIGLKKITKCNFDILTLEVNKDLEEQGAKIDGMYYCFHHPFAILKEYKKVCDCRKPNPGLLLQASKEHDIDLSKSWMIGDGVNDIIAGNKAKCKTILMANLFESEYLRMLEEKLEGIKPDYIIKNLKNAIEIIKE